MIKLFVAILAVSGTGGVSTSQVTTDYASLQSCLQMASTYGQPERQPSGFTVFKAEKRVTIGNQEITIRTSATCQPDGEPGMPPPVAGIIRGFMEGIR